MPKGFLPSFVKYSLSFGLLCLLLWPARAFANPSDMVTLLFTGDATCYPEPGTPCSLSEPLYPVGATITGVFSFDPDTQTVGSWYFFTPFGRVSSTDPGASADFFEPGTFFFDYYEMVLTFADPNGGPLLGGYIVSTIGYDPSIPPYVFTSGIATVGVTPEPSSLLLLGTGLLGLGPFLRRSSAHS
ncbi:MAG: PEP-CTERM sorting domain-containing protein [Candidatus Acidiferrales bacterium]